MFRNPLRKNQFRQNQHGVIVEVKAVLELGKVRIKVVVRIGLELSFRQGRVSVMVMVKVRVGLRSR